MSREDTGAPAGQTSQLSGKYLTFSLGQEEYGLPVLKVREIIKMMEITHVPRVPEHVRGVVNLRGKVIPVIDLRRKFGIPPQEQTDQTCIIVVAVDLAPGRVMMGVIVDSVSEVLTISASEIDETPELGGAASTSYILGLAKTRGTVKILIDADRALGGDGLAEYASPAVIDRC